MLFYISKADALAMGLTHEGTLFGVPAWFDGDGREVVMAAPKIPLLVIWCKLADLFYECASYFVTPDKTLVCPIHVERPIE